MNKIKFLARFLVFSTILFLAWTLFAETYVIIKYAFVEFSFNLVSDENLIFPSSVSYQSGAMTNIIPFIALVFATPKLLIGRRIKLTLFGTAILFFLEIITIDTFFFFEGYIGTRILDFMYGSGMIFFPVSLWIILLYRDIFPKETEYRIEENKKEQGYISAMKEILHRDIPNAKEKYNCPLCEKDHENITLHLKTKHKNKLRSRKVKEFLKKNPELDL